MTQYGLAFETVQKGVAEALQKWGDGASSEGLLDFLMIVREKEAAESSEALKSYQARFATNAVLEDALQKLAYDDEEMATLLRLRYQDKETLEAAAYILHVSPSTVSRHQNKAVEQLAQIIYAQEVNCRRGQVQEFEATLPHPTYTRLFGVAEAQRAVAAQLLKLTDPWVVALSGLGGIGKTALADAITRQIIQTFRFDRPLWLRSEGAISGMTAVSPQMAYKNIIAELTEQIVPEARAFIHSEQHKLVWQKLKARPYLVIIDNLEDEAGTEFLLEKVYSLANPTKFLLTTRTNNAGSAGVYYHLLNELPFLDAKELFYQHAQAVNLPEVARASEATVQKIYERIGGNPLALKLVVGLLGTIPLDNVLQDLAALVKDELYTRIYEKTWSALSSESQALLNAMTLVGSTGADADYIRKTSELSTQDFWRAVRELRQHSMLEVRGSLNERRYGIHRLTETFLMTNITPWLKDEWDDAEDDWDDKDDASAEASS